MYDFSKSLYYISKSKNWENLNENNKKKVCFLFNYYNINKPRNERDDIDIIYDKHIKKYITTLNNNLLEKKYIFHFIKAFSLI